MSAREHRHRLPDAPEGPRGRLGQYLPCSPASVSAALRAHAGGAPAHPVRLGEALLADGGISAAELRAAVPAVIDRLLADSSRRALGGEQREVTALFADSEGFTALAEDLDPEQLVRLLDEYFDETCALERTAAGHTGAVVVMPAK